jgi:hypothetical protein
MNGFAVAFNNASSAQEHGLYVGGTKYILNKIDDIENVPIMHCAKVRFLTRRYLFSLHHKLM